jgi:two-component system, NarL family, nitrate/nitrite response regulator NarL
MLAKVSDWKGEHRMRCVTVVIADQHPLVLEGLKNVLGAQHDFKVVACCSDGAGCIEAIRNFLPNIAIIDVSMPDLIGPEILAIANTENLFTRLVFFASSVADRESIIAAAADAYCVILKDVASEILVGVLRKIADCQRPLLPASSDWAVSREQRNGTIGEIEKISPFAPARRSGRSPFSSL